MTFPEEKSGCVRTSYTEGSFFGYHLKKAIPFFIGMAFCYSTCTATFAAHFLELGLVGF
jgi:hypothetical protein